MTTKLIIRRPYEGMTTNTVNLITRRPCEGRGPSQSQSTELNAATKAFNSAYLHDKPLPPILMQWTHSAKKLFMSHNTPTISLRCGFMVHEPDKTIMTTAIMTLLLHSATGKKTL
jgi:hypothetical protein